MPAGTGLRYGVQKSPGMASTYVAACSRRLAMGSSAVAAGSPGSAMSRIALILYSPAVIMAAIALRSAHNPSRGVNANAQVDVALFAPKRRADVAIESAINSLASKN